MACTAIETQVVLSHQFGVQTGIASGRGQVSHAQVDLLQRLQDRHLSGQVVAHLQAPMRLGQKGLAKPRERHAQHRSVEQLYAQRRSNACTLRVIADT